MRIVFLLVFVHCFIRSTYSQEHDRVWVFADSMALEFQQGSLPVLSVLPNKGHEPASNYCDSIGNLLYFISDSSQYASNYSILNQSGQIIQNGHNIAIDNSSTQGAMFLRHPKSKFLYLFGMIRFWGQPESLLLSTIDMEANGGLGAVIEKNKPILIDTLTEKMLAIRHANGEDWWVVLRRAVGPDFLSFLITEDTILGPVISSAGPFFPNDSYSINGAKIGYMSVNHEGSLLGLVDKFGRVSLHKFDRCSGVVQNPFFSLHANHSFYGCEFSPSGNRFYFSNATTSAHLNTQIIRIFQITIDTLNIQNSIVQVFFETINILPGETGNKGWGLGAMKRGIDNKIYLVNAFKYHDHIPNQPKDSITEERIRTLSVIQQPDSFGTLCSFSPYSVLLPKRARFGLPNIPNYRLGPVPVYQLDTPVLHYSIMPGDSVTLGIADTFPQVAYLWQSPQYPGWVNRKMELRVAPPATTTFYYIRTDTAATYSCNQRIDTIVVEVGPCASTTACPVPPICAGDTAWLCASGDGSYLWSPPYNLHNAASGGTLAWPETTTVYTVSLTLGNGCTATDSVTVIVHQNSPPTFEDTTIRKGHPFGEFFPTADTTIRYHYLNQYGCDSTVYWEVRIDTLNSIDNGQLIMDNLAVFPNPVRGILYVKHTNQNAAFRLYNKLGQVVIEQQNLPPGTAAVSLRGLAEGVYFWEYVLPGTGERVFGKTVKLSEP